MNVTEYRAAEMATWQRRRFRWSLWIPIILALPSVLFFLVFFVPSIGYSFMTSLWRYDFLSGAVVRDWNLANYSFLGDPWYLKNVWTTIRISLFAVLIDFLLGYPFAYFIMFYGGRFRGLFILLVIAPLLLTVVVRAMGWIMILGPGGIINQFLLGLGLRETPVMLVFNELGVVIALSQSHLPFMILPVLASLQRLDPTLPLAARGLGANAVQTFLRVTLPLSMPGILAGSILVFVTCATAFATPHILGGGRVGVMAELIYEKFMVLLNWPLGAALGLFLLVMVLVIVIAGQRWAERGRRLTGVFQ